MTLCPESLFKANLLGHLKNIHNDWLDGDKETKNGKKADLVNNSLNLCLKIKDDRTYEGIGVPSEIGQALSKTYDLSEMNKRYADDLKDANKKFQNYPGYKSILLIRTEVHILTVINAIKGTHIYRKDGSTGQLYYAGTRRKYSDHIYTNIGGFLVLNTFPGYCRYSWQYYFNDLANDERDIKKGRTHEAY